MFKKTVAFILIISLGFGARLQANAEEISVSAKAAVVVNAETGEVIFAQNENERLPMASTTKVMTALLLCENCNLEEEIITTKEMVTVEGSSMGLLEGDKVSFEALLYGMMLPSGNDAATTAAIAMSGSLESFALLMNKKAAEIGMDNSNFVTPSGLDAKKHYSTAKDMAKLAVYAMKNPIFKAVVATKSKTLWYGNPPYKRTIKGHNKILDIYDGGNGIKTGYTSKSGKCLISSAERDGKKVIAVTLNDSSTWANHSKLLDFGFERLLPKTLSLSKDQEMLDIFAGDAEFAYLEAETQDVYLTAGEIEKLRYEIKLPRFIFAPIKAGEKVGKIEFYIGEKLYKTLDIKAQKNVNKADYKKESFLERLLKLLKNMISV